MVSERSTHRMSRSRGNGQLPAAIIQSHLILQENDRSAHIREEGRYKGSGGAVCLDVTAGS